MMSGKTSLRPAWNCNTGRKRTLPKRLRHSMRKSASPLWYWYSRRKWCIAPNRPLSFRPLPALGAEHFVDVPHHVIDAIDSRHEIAAGFTELLHHPGEFLDFLHAFGSGDVNAVIYLAIFDLGHNTDARLGSGKNR